MTLAEEAQLYLEVVEAFRAEGCEPHWRPEQTAPPVSRPSSVPELVLPARRDRRQS